MSVGCAQALARHDLVERSDSRLQRAVQTAQRTCQEQQPKTALPSTADYERCVLVELRRAEVTAANRWEADPNVLRRMSRVRHRAKATGGVCEQPLRALVVRLADAPWRMSLRSGAATRPKNDGVQTCTH